MNHQVSKDGIVPISSSGQRFDQVAAVLFPEYSRARLQEWIKVGDITLNRQKVKPKTKVVGGEVVTLRARLILTDDWIAQEMSLDVIYEDEQLLVINKPADLVVHPAPGNYEGTLLNGLLYYLPSIGHVPRAGIVHRLDKDTTGLMVVAKTLEAQCHLVAQLQARTVSRQYIALLLGSCPSQGLVDHAIGRDPKNRKKMAVLPSGSSGGKEARTHFTVIAHLGPFSLVRLKLETGRTHQIRVHMASIGYPIVGDSVYGKKIPKTIERELTDPEVVLGFSRQALHAQSLAFVHPKTGEECSWSASLPDDMAQLIRSVGGDHYAG